MPYQTFKGLDGHRESKKKRREPSLVGEVLGASAEAAENHRLLSSIFDSKSSPSSGFFGLGGDFGGGGASSDWDFDFDFDFDLD